MLTFYYNPLSPNARRVWLTLLEKNLEFNPVVKKLNGDQFDSDFLDINPFHHIPVLVDDGFRLVESLAIMEYLEAKYPEPSLLPQTPKRLAQMRMVQYLTVNELMSILVSHICFESRSPQVQSSQKQLVITLMFLAECLGEAPYFGGETLSMGDIVAGAVMPLLRRVGFEFKDYGGLDAWCDRIMARPAWWATEQSDEGWHEFQRRIQVMARRKSRKQSQNILKPILPKQEFGGVA